MPFYLSIRRNYERAKRNSRVVVKIPSSGLLAPRIQVALSVNSSRGIIHAGMYPPKHEHAERMRSILQTSWTTDDFDSFMKDLLQEIFLRRERVKGKQLVFVLDGAREHCRERTTEDVLRGKHPELERYLSSTGGAISVMKAPPNSPQLNLCEYYNRTMPDLMEGHFFVVGWTSTPSWGKPRAFQTLVVFLFWRRPYRRPPQGGGSGPVPIHGEVQETVVSGYGGSRILLVAREENVHSFSAD